MSPSVARGAVGTGGAIAAVAKRVRAGSGKDSWTHLHPAAPGVKWHLGWMSADGGEAGSGGAETGCVV